MKNSTIGNENLTHLSKDELLSLVKNQKKLIQSLGKSEKRYQNLCNKSIDGIYKSSPNGKFIEVNSSLVKMLGYRTKEELLAIDIPTELYLSNDERMKHLKNAVLNIGQVVKLFKKDGSIISVEDYGGHVCDKDGNILYYEGIIRDVTEREKSHLIIKTLLRISEEGYKANNLKVFNQFIKEELGKLIDTTNFYIAFFNKEKQTIQIPFISGEDAKEEFPVGKSMTGYLIKNKKPILIKSDLYKQLIDLGEIELIGMFPKVWMGVPLKNKKEIIGAIVVQSYTNENAFDEQDINLLESISSHISTVVRRKKMESERNLSSQLLRNVLDNIPTNVFWKDKDSKFLGINKISLKETNIKDESEIIGKTDFDFYAIEDAKKYRADELAIMQSGKPKLNYIERSIRDGKEKSYVSNKIPFFNEKGEVMGIIGTSDDITERIENEEKLKKATEAAISANLSKSVFLSNMSHEIRTPMNAILGYSQLLQEDTNLTDEQQENLKIINRSGNHLLNLINDILDMSKIEAGRVNLNKSNFNFKNLITEIEQLLYIKSQEKKIPLTVKFNANVPHSLIGDEAKIRQVIINLIGNAIKFTKEGYVDVTVLSKSNKFIEVRVKDSGKGILKEDLELIFRPFEQAKKDGNVYGGTGLGLAISKKFANLMNGDIIASSIIKKGSEFIFTFQFEVGEEILNMNDHNQQAVIGLSEEMKGTKLAIVDDRFENRDILFKKLSSLGFSIKQAENGEEAVQLFQSWKPKIILMDIVMPVMNGVEATKKIIELDVNNETKIFIVSASALESEQLEVMKIGATSFIKKPVIFSELLDELETKGGIEFVYSNEKNHLNQIKNLITVNEIPELLKNKMIAGAVEGDFSLLQELVIKLKSITDKSCEQLENYINDLNFDSLVNWLNTKN